MAEKKDKKVVTTTTESISKQGDKTIKTVTTTTTTTSTKKTGWNSLAKAAKAAIIAGVALFVIAAALLIVFGRVKAVSSSMESTIAKDDKVFFNRFMNPIQGDVVVFHHPETDSVVPSAPMKNYYKMCRMYGQAWCSKSDVVALKLKKRPVYISRVYAEPGQIIEISDNEVFVNKKHVKAPESCKYSYLVVNNGILNPTSLDSIGLTKSDLTGEEDYAETYIGIFRNQYSTNASLSIYGLNANSAEKLSKFSIISQVEKIVLPKDLAEPTVFPYTEGKNWNQSNFGPLLVPQKGKVLKLNLSTLSLYRRCIEAYEGNTVEVKGNQILINGQPAESYKFKMNYYFVIGDNRTSKDDSRYFGFLPENHVMGVAM